MSWVVSIVLIAVLIGAYIWMFLYTRKRQKAFDEQYRTMKERHEIFVLNKKVVKEHPKSRWMKYVKFKTYQVTGRMNVSQAIRGMQMSKMQTINFHTTKQEYDKIQPNHRYKMDVAGNYIGLVMAPPTVKDKASKSWKRFFNRSAKASDRTKGKQKPVLKDSVRGGKHEAAHEGKTAGTKQSRGDDKPMKKRDGGKTSK